MHERYASVAALSEMKQDFYLILSEIEKAQTEKTPHSAAVKTYPVETTLRGTDEGDVQDSVFEWLGQDDVFRNVQFIIESPEQTLPQAWIQIHAWQDNDAVRRWKTEEIERKNLEEFRSNRKHMLATLERAYTTVCSWKSVDLAPVTWSTSPS